MYLFTLQNSIREPQKGAAGGREEGNRRCTAGSRRKNQPQASLLVRPVIITRAGGPARIKSIQKIFFRNSLTVPKIVAQCRKRVFPYLYTLRRTTAYAYTLPNAIAYLNTCVPYLNTCITYLNTLTRLSALGSISFYMHYLS